MCLGPERSGEVLVAEDGEDLYRHLMPGMVQDGKLGLWVFGSSEGDMSVDLGRCRDDLAELEWLNAHNAALGVCAFVALDCLKQVDETTKNPIRELVYDPTEGVNDAHCYVRGAKPKSLKRALWATARVLREPTMA